MHSYSGISSTVLIKLLYLPVCSLCLPLWFLSFALSRCLQGVWHHWYQMSLGRGGKVERLTVWMNSSRTWRTQRCPERKRQGTRRETSWVRNSCLCIFLLDSFVESHKRNQFSLLFQRPHIICFSCSLQNCGKTPFEEPYRVWQKTKAVKNDSKVRNTMSLVAEAMQKHQTLPLDHLKSSGGLGQRQKFSSWLYRTDIT